MDCCENKKENKKDGIINGILYGILPHSFCILFIVFSVVGATLFSSYFKKVLLLPYFFPVIIILSLLFATVSAYFYLRKNNQFSKAGIKKSRNYLISLYLITISINILFVYVVFPAFNNYYFNQKSHAIENQNNNSKITLQVDIPCSGHVSLIDNELRNNNGIIDIKFEDPNIFTIIYNKNFIKEEEILNLKLFQTFKAKKI